MKSGNLFVQNQNILFKKQLSFNNLIVVLLVYRKIQYLGKVADESWNNNKMVAKHECCYHFICSIVMRAINQYNT